MIKKRYFSTKNDFGTGLFYKISLILGFFLLFILLLLKLFSIIFYNNNNVFIQYLYDISQSTISDTLLALSIIFLGFGFILYFFYLQFKKLSDIADEIENEENIEKSN
jgi:hypothetical protein